MEKVFLDVFAEFSGSNGCLATGSVIMVGSVSHLGQRGLESYVNDLCRVFSSMGTKVGSGVEIVPYVPVPLGGVESGATLHGLLDFDAWLLASGLGPGVRLQNARQAFWKVVKEVRDTAVGCTGGERVYFLQASLKNPRKSSIRSVDPTPALPGCLPPLTEAQEKEIVTAVATDTVENFGIDFDQSLSLLRGAGTREYNDGNGRVVLVGASHMCRLAEQLPAETVTLAVPGFKPTPENIPEIATKLRNLELGKSDSVVMDLLSNLVVMDLLSNLVFMGTSEEGNPIPATRGQDGKFHVEGSLTTAPPTALKKNLATCVQLLTEVSEANLILMGPIPRYVTEKCCGNPGHIENFDNADLEDEIMDAQETHRRLLMGWATSHGYDPTYIDATTLVASADPSLRNRKSSGGAPLWAVGNPVHLSPASYWDLAAAILEAGVDINEEATSSSILSSEGSSKRKRLESVVTRPPGCVSKRSKGRGVQAAWLTGKAEPQGGNTWSHMSNKSVRGTRGSGRSARGGGYRSHSGGRRGPMRGWAERRW
jgi:hypothetical protein